MNKCSQCAVEFIESSTLYQRRIRSNTPIICSECNRIEQAEMRAYIRNNRPKPVLGVFSMMRKYKLTYEEALKKVHNQ